MREETFPDRTQRFYRYTSEILYALSAVGRYHSIMETYTIASLFATALIAGQPVGHMAREP
jgi:hypothetical protein